MATQRQNKAISIVVEKRSQNGGKASVSAAMREAGYSPATAKTPKKLTTSKTWQQLMDEHLPDQLLAEKHKELLNAKKKVTVKNKKGDILIETEEENTDAIARGLDMGYKLKGKYKPTQVEVRSFVGWTPQELEEYASSGYIPERFITES